MYDMYMLVYDEWSISLLICLICVACLYFYVLKRLEINYLSKRPLLFCSGLCLLYITMGSPLLIISHLSLSSHMILMSIHYFIIPPLILLGIPSGFLSKVYRFLLNPVIALYIFACLFLMYHMGSVLQFFAAHPYIHNLVIGLLFYLAICMWWPVIVSDLDKRVLRGRKKRYIFLSGLLLMPACSLLIINGLIDHMSSSPLGEGLAMSLCLPGELNMQHFLPFPFNTKYDPFIAGALMIAIHKLSLLLTFRISNKITKKVVHKLPS